MQDKNLIVAFDAGRHQPRCFPSAATRALWQSTLLLTGHCIPLFLGGAQCQEITFRAVLNRQIKSSGVCHRIAVLLCLSNINKHWQAHEPGRAAIFSGSSDTYISYCLYITNYIYCFIHIFTFINHNPFPLTDCIRDWLIVTARGSLALLFILSAVCFIYCGKCWIFFCLS